MNQAFDMRLDIKPAAPRPNKPAPNKADKSASDSDFHKTLENATASKQPQQDEQVQGGVSSDMQQKPVENPQTQTEDGVMQQDTVDLQNVAAMMAAAMMPAIVMPEQMEQAGTEQAPQMVITDVEGLVPVMTAETVVPQQQEITQPAAAPVMQQMEQAAQQQQPQSQPMQQQTEAEQQITVTVERQPENAPKIAEPQAAAMQEGQDKNTAVVTEAGAAVQTERPLFERVEATPIQVAEPVRADEPAFPTQLAQRIDKAAAQGVNTIEVQLTPYELGKITIRLTVTEEGMQISMHSANSKTVGLLAEHAANIGAIVEHNHSGSVSVSVEQEQQPDQYTQQEHHGNGQQQEQQQQEHRHAPPQNDDFIQQLRLGLAGLI
ncbi:MAG: flagellar hook-length control protein FliK [Butyricicoccus pullicaecorum]|nr:flagellar hook-length control protein FliK [Butyricicoccus pullicaecorum]